jgi:hypothetical protein
MKRLFSCLVLSLVVSLATACDDKSAKTPETGSDKAATKTDEGGADKKAEADKKADDKGAADKKADGEKAADKGTPAEDKPLSKEDGEGGQIIESELYNVKFTVPKAWKVSKGPTGITVTSEDGGIQMLVAGSKSQDVLEAVLRDLKDNVTFKDVNIEKQGTTAINGLIGLRGEGAAKLVEGEKESAIKFVAFLSKVDQKSVTALVFTSPERYTKDLELIEGVLGTLSKK